MKKISKSLLTFLSTSVIVAPTISLTSCGGASNIIEPKTEEKQHTCDEGTNICTYSFEVKENVKLEDSSEVYVELTDIKTDREDVEVNLVDQKATRDGRKFKFQVKISAKSNNQTNIAVEFSSKFECKTNGKSDWTQKVSGYKITKVVDTEQHTISANSNVFNVEAKSDKLNIDETTPVTLTFTNKRTTDVEDAKLVVFANEKSIVLNIGSIKYDEPKVISYTKAQLQEEFAKQQLTIGDNDSISFSLTRVGAYHIQDKRLYKYNIYNVPELCSDDELDTLENKFLYYDDENFEYHINDEELTFPKYIQSTSSTKANHVYLLKGTYWPNGANCSSGIAELHVYGLLNSKNEKVSSFRTYRDRANPEFDYGMGEESIKFYIDDCNMLGRPTDPEKTDWITDGMVCPYLECNNCDFTGSYTASTTKCHFYNCTFNTSNTTKGSRPGLKNNNAMFLYGGSTADFENCTFNSIGKAVKIYYGTVAESKTFEFNFKGCKFNLLKNYCNFIEYPIDIDAAQHTGPTIFNISIDNGCEMNQLWKDKLAEQGATNIQLFHPNDTTVSGKAAHILINNEAPVPFVWDPQTPLPDPE